MSRQAADESEWQTRKRRIDGLLTGQGWKVIPSSKARSSSNPLAIEEFATDNGPADYSLQRDGQILGVVEAKRLSIGPQNVLSQSERYAKGVSESPFNFNGFRVPFLYSTKAEGKLAVKKAMVGIRRSYPNGKTRVGRKR